MKKIIKKIRLVMTLILTVAMISGTIPGMPTVMHAHAETTTSTITVGSTDYTLFTGFTATDGNGTNYAKLVDGNTSTDWIATKSFVEARDFNGGTSDPAYVEFHADAPIIPKGYVLTCDHENAGFWKPVEWALKAKLNEGDEWTTIHSSNTTLGVGKTFEIACDNNDNNEYQYFRFEVYEVGGTMTVDLDELQFYGLLPAYTHLTVKAATCTATGIKRDCYRRESDGKYFTDETGTTELPESDVIAPMISHSGDHHEATDMNIEYWQCSMCGKYFSDEGYTTEITEEQTKIYRTITIDGSISGLVTCYVSQVLAGETVYLYVSDLIDASTLKVNNGAVELTAVTDIQYAFTMPAADVTVTADVAQSNADGDILTGSIRHTVTIPDGASITLSNAAISGSIVCEGAATITLVGTNSVSGATNKAGIQIGGSGTTLTIKGDGSLTANGGDQSAGIGLGRAWLPGNDVIGGNIVIEGGNITANGGSQWGAGIGTGVIFAGGGAVTARIGNITIKGGTVKATGGSDADGIGTGYTYTGCTNAIGTVTIYDDIDKVDASSITENVTYMHDEEDVTATASDYFTIIEDGNRRIIAPKDDTDYIITIADDIEHGTLTGAATAKYCEEVTITVTPDSGYRLTSLVVKDVDNNDVATTGNSFFMPKGDVTVSAVFEQGTHGTTEFSWRYSGPDAFGTEAIYDGVTTVELQQWQSYEILKYDEDSYRIFLLDNDIYNVTIPYSGGTGTFTYANGTNFGMDYNGESGFYDITMTDVGNGKWSVSILKTVGVIDNIPDQTYTGSEIKPEPQVMAGSLSLTKGTDYEYSYSDNTNVGTAKVIVTFKGDYASLGSVEKEFTITKATPTVTAPTANTLTYNGNEQELVAAGSTDFGKVLYSLDGETYSENIPKGKDAGTYTVYYKVEGSDNWNAVEPQPVEITIKKATAVINTISKVDKDGNQIDGNIEGTGSYPIGSEVTFTAPKVEGYNFVGWYKHSDASPYYTGEKLGSANTYTFTATEDADYTAVYEARGKASVTIGGGSSFTINGSEKSSQITTDYTLGSTITVSVTADDFAYWANSYGMVLSREKTYSFTVTGADTVTAVFDTVIENKATVIFESAYGQVMARNQLASGEPMSIPSVPTLNGYNAIGWDMDGDGSYDAEKDTLATAITKGLAAESKMVTIRPLYQLKETKYTISVTNGSGAGQYNQNDVVTVTANVPEAGQKFSHWKDSGDKILSYDTTYTFFAEKDMSITAVYVADTVVVEAKGTTEIINMYKDTENNKLTFVSMSTVPEGCTINKAGVIATNNETVGTSGDGFNASTAMYVLGNAWSGTAYRYTLTKGKVNVGDTWYVRAYLVYTDASGNSHTIYGDMVSQTY